MHTLEVFAKNLAVALIDRIVGRRNGVVMYFGRDAGRRDFLKLYRQIKSEVELLLNFHEAYQIYLDVKATAGLPGAIAEVGPYMGGSAKIICEAKGDKTLYLFDTFEGLPSVDLAVDGSFRQGDFDGKKYTSDLYGMIKEYLKGYPNVRIYKGTFPATAGPVENERFSFVHLDVDIYSSTLAGLEFFYPRLVPGGILISHDYEDGPGVQKAFNEYFADKPEPVVALRSGKQCLIVKQ